MHINRYIVVRLLSPLLLPGLLEGCKPSFETPGSPSPTSASTSPEVAPVEYRDAELGLSFSLPASWEGFSVRNSSWEGLAQDAALGDVVVEQGPMISIDHPQSTIQEPRQEIPIMVFTIEQWDRMQAGEWHIGAAPFNPLELGRNSRYVFALPARYNYAFPEGWEEVEQILQGHPLETFEPGVTQ